MKTLVALLRFGLFGADLPAGILPLDEEEWQSVFDLSRRQGVTALIYDAILKLPQELRPKRKVLFHFTSMTQTIEQDNRSREDALTHYASIVRSRLSLPTVVVKGSSIACYYPNPLHRECGDNDIYTGGDTESVGRIFEQGGLTVDRKDPRHISFSLDSVTFECHSYLLYHNDDLDWRTVPLGNTGIHTLQREQSAFFIAKHIEHHAVFFHQPVRLRDLVDWSMLITSAGFDWSNYNIIKRDTDVDVFADLMTAYCVDLFGLEDVESKDMNGLCLKDFERLYMQCPERHKLAAVRVARRSWKYLRFGRQYKAIYGQSMFRRFYLHNVKNAIKQRFE